MAQVTDITSYPDKDSEIAELKDRLAELRMRLHLISIVEQGCGGSLTPVEMANSAMQQAKQALLYDDQLVKEHTP